MSYKDYIFDSDFEYCGDCPVCGDPVNHSDAGFCDACGKAFCWGSCGTWRGSKHCCNECNDDIE